MRKLQHLCISFVTENRRQIYGVSFLIVLFPKMHCFSNNGL